MKRKQQAEVMEHRKEKYIPKLLKRIGVFFNSLKFNSRLLILSVSVAFLIVVADYYLSNYSYPIFDSSDTLGINAFIKDYQKDSNDNQLFCVNVSKDKALAAEYNQYGDTAGLVGVTDRAKLSEFLDIAALTDYKYIFLDIRFEKNLTTPHDSALFSRIAAMPRLVYSRHREFAGNEIDIPGMIEKGGYADFRSILSKGFSRYEFLQDNQESVALRLYHDITGKTIRPTSLGGYKDSDGSLCYNLQFIPLPKSIRNLYDEDYRVLYPLLGSQIMAKHSPEELIVMMKGKVIVIGDFEQDRHDTYIGKVPGPLITYHAWKLLERGGHKLNIWLQLFLLVFYTVSVYLILAPAPNSVIKNPLITFVLSFLGWGFGLWLIKSAIFWLFGLSFLIAIPATVFSLLEMVKKIYNMRKLRKTNNSGVRTM